MILLNFGHPLTPQQRAAISAVTGESEFEVREVATHLDHEHPFDPQVVALVEAIGLSPVEWQTEPILVNPPGYVPAAVTLLAHLHGRIGHFPAIVRLRPVAGSVPTRYEVAEVLDLQTARDGARARRERGPT